MNRKTFRENVVLVITIYAIAIGAGLFLSHQYPEKDSNIYKTYTDLIPLIIAIPAAWLAFCFQNRQAYLKDVRDLWSKIVIAVQGCIQYTHADAPSRQKYAETMLSLSIVIDEMRGTFSNYGEMAGRAGLYPFETIKKIQAITASLGFEQSFDVTRATLARKDIVNSWKELRSHYLNELERGLPASKDSPYLL